MERKEKLLQCSSLKGLSSSTIYLFINGRQYECNNIIGGNLLHCLGVPGPCCVARDMLWDPTRSREAKAIYYSLQCFLHLCCLT